MYGRFIEAAIIGKCVILTLFKGTFKVHQRMGAQKVVFEKVQRDINQLNFRLLMLFGP